MKYLELYFKDKEHPVVVDFEGTLPEPIEDEPYGAYMLRVVRHLRSNALSRRMVVLDIEAILAVVESTPVPEGQIPWRGEESGEFSFGPQETV